MRDRQGDRARERDREKEKRERARQKNGSVARLAAAGLRQLPKKKANIYTNTQHISDWYQKLQQDVEQHRKEKRIEVGGGGEIRTRQRNVCDCCVV